MPQSKSGHVTLSDVANATGYSVSTVSIILSGAPLSANVAASTRETIRAAAKRLGYHPDARARSLRKQRSGTIGVLAYDLSDPYCMPVVQGVQHGLQATDYLPLVMDAQTERKVFDKSLRLMLERRVEGVVVIASWMFDETSLLADIKKNGVPTLVVGRDLTPSGITSYLLDNEQGGRLAMEHLLQLGHKKIAVIRGPDGMFDSAPRWKGMLRALQQTSVTLAEQLTPQLPLLNTPGEAFEAGRSLVKHMLKSRRRFTAILAFDDLTALGVVRGLHEAGKSVPDDCSVVGFDDVLPARVATPAITTVHQPMRQMGLKAIEHMLTLVEKPGAVQELASLCLSTPELVERASTAVAAKKRALLV